MRVCHLSACVMITLVSGMSRVATTQGVGLDVVKCVVTWAEVDHVLGDMFE